MLLNIPVGCWNWVVIGIWGCCLWCDSGAWWILCCCPSCDGRACCILGSWPEVSGVDCWAEDCTGGTVAAAELEVDSAAVSGVPTTVHVILVSITLSQNNNVYCIIQICIYESQHHMHKFHSSTGLCVYICGSIGNIVSIKISLFTVQVFGIGPKGQQVLNISIFVILVLSTEIILCTCRLWYYLTYVYICGSMAVTWGLLGFNRVHATFNIKSSHDIVWKKPV